MIFEGQTNDEKIQVEASNKCYSLLEMKAKALEQQGISGDELAKKKAEFLSEQAENLRKSTIEMKPELKEAMIKWYEEAAAHLRS
ncbi:MAG: hypothetical protein HY507_00370 [Candidatus Zambryskibacteria bacterium]|nr:hypothetical protein [Candidatus Zambryskibacteria bacterium]